MSDPIIYSASYCLCPAEWPIAYLLLFTSVAPDQIDKGLGWLVLSSFVRSSIHSLPTCPFLDPKSKSQYFYLSGLSRTLPPYQYDALNSIPHLVLVRGFALTALLFSLSNVIFLFRFLHFGVWSPDPKELGMMDVIRPRRPHHKSRTGCLQCKSRKVKVRILLLPSLGGISPPYIASLRLWLLHQ